MNFKKRMKNFKKKFKISKMNLKRKMLNKIIFSFFKKFNSFLVANINWVNINTFFGFLSQDFQK
jgi:hypothetical protein